VIIYFCVCPQVRVLRAVRLPLAGLPLRVAEQLHPLRPLRQPGRVPRVPGELPGGGAAAAVSALRPVGSARRRRATRVCARGLFLWSCVLRRVRVPFVQVGPRGVREPVHGG